MRWKRLWPLATMAALAPFSPAAGQLTCEPPVVAFTAVADRCVAFSKPVSPSAMLAQFSGATVPAVRPAGQQPGPRLPRGEVKAAAPETEEDHRPGRVDARSRAPGWVRGGDPCASTPSDGTVVFCDDFDGGSIAHTSSARPVVIDGAPPRWYSFGGDWKSSAFIHSCELQYYTLYGVDYSVAGPENYVAPGHVTNFAFDVPNGTLSLTLRQENIQGYIPNWMSQPANCWMSWSLDSTPPAPMNNHSESFSYSSGWLETPALFRYGRFEIRARIPNQGRVVWPAFWLFGGAQLDGGMASYGEGANEIDIFEFTGYDPHHFTRNVHNYFSLSHWLSVYGDPSDYPELEECTNTHWSPTCNFHRDVANDTITFHHGYGQDLTVDVSQWHTYAVEWTPRRLTWFLDGQQISPSQVEDIPTNAMTLIINNALPDWLSDGINNGVVNGHDTSLTLPAPFEIDWVRVIQLEDKDFVWKWGNGGTNFVHWWYLNDEDSFLVGNFDADPADELFAINPTSGYAHLMDYAPPVTTGGGWTWTHDNAKWSTQWSNLGTDRVHWWDLNPGDQYVVGNFAAESGDAKDEVLAINAATGFAHLMRYTGAGTGWTTAWANLGSDSIHWWLFNHDDRFVSANFDVDAQDELLAINERTGYAHLMDYNGSNWMTIWATSGGQIHWWIFHAEDDYVSGDFDNNGEEDLLAINVNTGWAQMMNYDDASHDFVMTWSNGGTGNIHWWLFNPGDRFVAADFDGDASAELLAVNGDAQWSHLMRFDHATSTRLFQHIWGTGDGVLHRPTRTLPGDFVAGGYRELLSIAGEHAYVQSYERPGSVIKFD